MANQNPHDRSPHKTSDRSLTSAFASVRVPAPRASCSVSRRSRLLVRSVHAKGTCALRPRRRIRDETEGTQPRQACWRIRGPTCTASERIRTLPFLLHAVANREPDRPGAASAAPMQHPTRAGRLEHASACGPPAAAVPCALLPPARRSPSI